MNDTHPLYILATCFILGGVVWFVLTVIDQALMVIIPHQARRGCGFIMAMFATIAGLATTALFLFAWLGGAS